MFAGKHLNLTVLPKNALIIMHYFYVILILFFIIVNQEIIVLYYKFENKEIRKPYFFLNPYSEDGDNIKSPMIYRKHRRIVMYSSMSKSEMIGILIQKFSEYGWEISEHHSIIVFEKNDYGFIKRIFVNKRTMYYLAYDDATPFRFLSDRKIEKFGGSRSTYERLMEDDEINLAKCVCKFCTYLGDWILEPYAENYLRAQS